MNTDTPRTEELLLNLSDYQTRDPINACINLARQLESEAASWRRVAERCEREAQEARATLGATVSEGFNSQEIDGLNAANSGLRAENARLQDAYKEIIRYMPDSYMDALTARTVYKVLAGPSAQAATMDKDATIARLLALVQDAYDDPDSEILGKDWNEAALAALNQE